MPSKIKPSVAISKTEIEAARVDVNTFAELVIDNEDFPGQPIRQAPVHIEGHRILNRYPNVILELHREAGKTVNFLIARILWKMGIQPWRRRIIVTANKDEAHKRIIAIANYILHKPILRAIFPWLIPLDRGDWSKSTIQIYRFIPDALEEMIDPDSDYRPQHAISDKRFIISKDPSLDARGVLGAGTGARADEIYYDDPVDFRNAIVQPGLRKVVIDAYANQWENVKAKEGGEQVFLGTTWTEDDLIAHLKSTAIKVGDPEADTAAPERWRHFRGAVRKDTETGRWISPWPEKFTHERLEAIRFNIKDPAFARAYLLKPVSDSERMFSEECLNKILPTTLNSLPKRNKNGKMIPAVTAYGGLDLAISKKRSADLRSLTSILLTSKGHRVLTDVRTGKWGSVETADVVIDEHKIRKYAKVMIESNAYQAAFKEWVRERTKQRILAGNLDPGFHLTTDSHTTTGVNRLSEEVGLPSLASEFEADRWLVILPESHEAGGMCVCWFCQLKGELAGLQRNGETVAETKDRVFSTWFAREAVATSGERSIGAVGKDSRTTRKEKSETRIRRSKRERF